MYKRILSLAISGLLINLVCYSTAAACPPPKQSELAGKVKVAVAKLGTGGDARVEVWLQDKKKLRGYIGAANEEGFVVVDAKTSVATRVAYPQVRKVKGSNHLSGEKIAIGVIVVSLMVIGILIGADRIDP